MERVDGWSWREASTGSAGQHRRCSKFEPNAWQLAWSYIQNPSDFIRPFGNVVTVRLPVIPSRWLPRNVKAMRAEAKKAIVAGVTGAGVSAVKQRDAIVAVETLLTSEDDES